MLAMQHGKSRRAAEPIRFEGRSEAGHHFKEVPHCYASMDKKPLVPYSPNASRSRLAREDAPVPLKNASTIEFRDPQCVHKRRFVTTHQNHFDGSQADLTSNSSIIAEKTRLKRYLLEK